MNQRSIDQSESRSREEIKVLVVITGHEGFGVRTNLLSDAAHGDQYGIRFEFLCLDAGGCFETLRNKGARATALGIDLTVPYPRHPMALPWVWVRRSRNFRSAYRAVIRQLHVTRPDIVYTHNVYLHLLCGLAAKRAGCRAVGRFPHDLNRKRLFGAQRVLCSLACAGALDRIVTITSYAHRSLWGPARTKAALIHNGIDINAIRESVGHSPKVPGRLVLVGRLVDWKKQDVAIRAMRILADQKVSCRLDIVGGPVTESNSYYQGLRKLVVDLALDGQVAFRGVVSPPYELMASAIGLISCSTREPFGLVMVESMACATPTVVADSGASAELVVDNETGLHYEADSPESLARALGRLLSDVDLGPRLADAAYKDALKRFDIRIHMEGLRGLFDALTPVCSSA